MKTKLGLGFFVLLTIIFCGLNSAYAANDSFSITHSFSEKGTEQPFAWRLKLEFNKPVSTLELSKHIKYKENGKNKKIKILNTTELNKVEKNSPLPMERKIFVITPQKPSKKEVSSYIHVSSSLKSADKKQKLSSGINIDFDLKDSISVICHNEYYYSASNKGIYIYLSEKIKDYELKNQLKIFPPIGYFSVRKVYNRTENQYRISGNFVTNKDYQLTIKGGAIGKSGKVLLAKEIKFKAKGPDPEIRFDAKRSVIELKSKQLVPLSFVNTGNFKCQIMRIPPLFIPEFDDLSVFPEGETKRPSDSDGKRISKEEKEKIEKASLKLENDIVQAVEKFKAAKSLAKKGAIPALDKFLNQDFSSDSEGYLGSDNLDKNYYFSLPLDSRPNPTVGGPLIVKVNEVSKKDGAQATRLFQITDLSITYKFSGKDILFWVTSIETGEPVKNAELMLSLANGNLLFPGKTNANGLLIAKNSAVYKGLRWNEGTPEIFSQNLKISELKTAAVATEKDSSYVRLNTNRFFPSMVKQQSPEKAATLSAKGHIFTERGVYRQGEKVYWKATLREYRDGQIVPPYKKKASVTIKDSLGEEIFDEELEINRFGTCSGSLQLKSYSPLGSYYIKVMLEEPEAEDTTATTQDWDFLMNRKTSSKKVKSKEPQQSKKKIFRTVSTTSFQVQDFEPPRHFVEISMEPIEKEVERIVGQKSKQKYLKCVVSGKYYTGGPVRHAKVQWTANLVGNSSSVKGFAHYHFGNNDKSKQLIESGNAVLDKNGDLVLAFPTSDEIVSGISSIEVSATVLDVDGRPSTSIKTYAPKSKIKVGISKLPDNITQGEKFPVQIIALDSSNNKINSGKIQLDILRKRWFYTQKRDSDGGIYYNWTSGWIRSQTSDLQIKNGLSVFELLLADSGDYRIQATYQSGKDTFKSAYDIIVGYSYHSFNDQDGRRRTRSENEFILMPEKSMAAVNDKIKFRYSLPKPAKYALITKERKGILSARIIKLNGRQGMFTETITPDAKPNLYVSMMAPGMRSEFPIYNSQIDSEYPRPYFAVTNIKVQNKLDKLQLSIAPDKEGELTARPGDTQKLKLKVLNSAGEPAQAEVALCVVDEAILSLTGYNTPKLDKLTDFILPLSVFTGDLRTSLISQELYRLISTRPLTGGGGGAENVTASLDIRKDFRPVAYWNAGLITDKNGLIEAEFKLPDTTTAYRIFAVAINDRIAFKSSQRNLRVFKDFYIEPQTPRFLTAGDKAVFPLSLNNKSDKAGKASIEIIDGQNIVLKPQETEKNLQPFTNSTVKMEIEADNGAGEAKMVIKGDFEGHTDAIERKLPIVPATTIINRHQFGHFTVKDSIKPDFPTNLDTAIPELLNGTLKARLTLTTSQWNKIAPSLEYLLRYPYGCVEQTSSGIIPLASIRKLAQEGQLPNISIERIDKFLKAGITRLFKMQTYSGGFAYWQGGSYPSWWGTQYAILALTLAKKAGIEIDESRFNEALKYARRELFRNNKDRFRHGVLALAVSNLAMNGKLDAKDFQTLASKFEKTQKEAIPLLIFADSLVKASPINVLQAKLKKLKPIKKSVSRNWYDSSARTAAFSLIANLSAKGTKKQAENLVGFLLNSIGPDGKWNSTSDTGIALFALSMYFQEYASPTKENVLVEIKIGDKIQKQKTGKHGITIELNPIELLKAKEIKLTSSHKAMVNWTLLYEYPDLTTRDKPVNKGFSISKTIENLNGEKEIKVGDLVKVTIEFEDDAHQENVWQRYHYLAIDDPLPAGFIAVNPALKSEQSRHSEEDEEQYCYWFNGAYSLTPDHHEMKNEKVLIFKDRIWSGRFRYIYYARAICEGSFKLKPTRLSLMYDPEIFALTTAKTIKVLPMK